MSPLFKPQADELVRRLMGAPAAPLGTPRPTTAPCGTPDAESPGEPPTQPESPQLSDASENGKPRKRTITVGQLALPDLGCHATVEQDGLGVRGVLLHFEPVDTVLDYSLGGGEISVLVPAVLVRFASIGTGEDLERLLLTNTPITLTRLEA